MIERNEFKLGVKNNGVIFVIEGDFYVFESVVKIENYGVREVIEVKIIFEIYEIKNG